MEMTSNKTSSKNNGDSENNDKGFKIPLSKEQKEIGKNMALQIAKLEEQKNKLKLDKKEKWDEMKIDKKNLSEVFQVIGTDKLKDKNQEWVVKNVPDKWYKKKGMKLIYKAVENILGVDSLEKLKIELSKKKKTLSENLYCETTVVFKNKDKRKEVEPKKIKNDRNSTKRKESKKRRILDKLETK